MLFLIFQTRSVETQSFPRMVQKSYMPSNLAKPQQGGPDQEMCIKKASKEDNNFKMILTIYILGVAVFWVIIALTKASIRDHDELFYITFFLIIAFALLAMCFNWFMYFKIEEKKAAEMEEKKKTMTGAPENTSIVSGYGTVDKTYQDYIPIPIP